MAGLYLIGLASIESLQHTSHAIHTELAELFPYQSYYLNSATFSLLRISLLSGDSPDPF